jgi:hypothetical protein
MLGVKFQVLEHHDFNTQLLGYQFEGGGRRCLPIPGIVYAELMPAGRYWNRYGITVHELGDALAV